MRWAPIAVGNRTYNRASSLRFRGWGPYNRGRAPIAMAESSSAFFLFFSGVLLMLLHILTCLFLARNVVA